MYIVIDTWDVQHPCIVVDMKTGIPLVFSSHKKAQEEANECQKAIVVKIA